MCSACAPCSCAIVTGVGTVLADDCALTVRADELGLPGPGSGGAPAQPLRVVLDSACRRRAAARVLRWQALPCCAIERRAGPGIWPVPGELCALPRSDDGLDLHALMADLTARQCNEILVESGPRLAGALLQAGLLDELIVYMAPTLMGDRARPLLQLPLDSMADKVPLQVEDVRKWARTGALPHTRLSSHADCRA